MQHLRVHFVCACSIGHWEAGSGLLSSAFLPPRLSSSVNDTHAVHQTGLWHVCSCAWSAVPCRQMLYQCAAFQGPNLYPSPRCLWLTTATAHRPEYTSDLGMLECRAKHKRMRVCASFNVHPDNFRQLNSQPFWFIVAVPEVRCAPEIYTERH